VKLFYNIRLKLGKRSLEKKSRRITRSKIVHNFSTAQKICIIFEGSCTENIRYIKKFRQYLESLDKETFMLGYIDADEIPGEIIFWRNTTVFNKKDTDIVFRPKKYISTPFLEKKFDILIDLSLKEYFPLQYLNCLSSSSFKVGRFGENQNDHDLMINIGEDTAIDYLIDQIKHYVTLLNNPVNVPTDKRTLKKNIY